MSNHQRPAQAFSSVYVEIIVFCTQIHNSLRRQMSSSFPTLLKPLSLDRELREAITRFRQHVNNVEDELRICHMIDAADRLEVNENDRDGGTGNLHMAEAVSAVPFSDSGYASTVKDKFKGKQVVQIENHAQTTGSAQPQHDMDEGYDGSTQSALKSDNTTTEDNRTVYSDDSSITGFKYEGYISEFADNLFSKFRDEKVDQQTMERILSILTELLKAFALKLGHNASSQMQRDVMYFVHRYRR